MTVLRVRRGIIATAVSGRPHPDRPSLPSSTHLGTLRDACQTLPPSSNKANFMSLSTHSDVNTSSRVAAWGGKCGCNSFLGQKARHHPQNIDATYATHRTPCVASSPLTALDRGHLHVIPAFNILAISLSTPPFGKWALTRKILTLIQSGLCTFLPSNS